MAGTDIETGEIISLLGCYNGINDIDRITSNYNLETGEPYDCLIKKQQHLQTKSSVRKSTFIVPKELINSTREKQHYNKTGSRSLKCRIIHPHNNYTLSKKKEVINLKEEIILGCNKTSYRLFLIPSIFFFTKVIGSVIMGLEILIHIWAHHKNKRNTNPSIYYRSPLHIITSQFCGICRNEFEMEQVSKLQDRRTKNRRLNLKVVTRTIA